MTKMITLVIDFDLDVLQPLMTITKTTTTTAAAAVVATTKIN